MKSVISPDGAERLATGCGLAAAYALSTMYIYAAVYIVVDLVRPPSEPTLSSSPANVIGAPHGVDSRVGSASEGTTDRE